MSRNNGVDRDDRDPAYSNSRGSGRSARQIPRGVEPRMSLAPMPTHYDDNYPESSNYQLSSRAYSRKGRNNVDSWLQSTSTRDNSDDGLAWPLYLSEIPCLTEYGLDATCAPMMTQSMETTGYYDNLVTKPRMPYDDEHLYMDVPFPSSLGHTVPVSLGPLDTSYQHESQVFYPGMDSSLMIGKVSPDLTNASTVSAISPPEDFPAGFALPSVMTKAESLIVDDCGHFDNFEDPAFRPRPHRPIRSAPKKHDHVQDYPPSPEDSQDGDKPRNHPYYDYGPDCDGLFRCPTPLKHEHKCSHKPTPQRCIYAKNLDSHLKPWKCKFIDPECQSKTFSSAACLFRHERETHGLHGHGDNPHICPYQNCERSKPGNGFPRRWNLGDHIKRVHKGRLEDAVHRRGHREVQRKRKGPAMSVPMRRSVSSQHAKVALACSDPKMYGSSGNAAPNPSIISQAAPRFTVPTENIRYSQVSYSPVSSRTYQQLVY